LAALALRVSALETRLLLVQEMAHRWHLRAVKCGVARAPARALWEKRPTQRGDSGLPVRKDERCRRRTKRLRSRQEGARQEETSAGVHRRIGSQSQSPQRKDSRPRGLTLLLKAARECLPRLSHPWVDAGYQSRGKEWAEQELGISVEVVHRSPKPIPEKIAMIWAEEWAKEGKEIDWQKLLPH
jgi:hypothetical protein